MRTSLVADFIQWLTSPIVSRLQKQKALRIAETNAMYINSLTDEYQELSDFQEIDEKKQSTKDFYTRWMEAEEQLFNVPIFSRPAQQLEDIKPEKNATTREKTVLLPAKRTDKKNQSTKRTIPTIQSRSTVPMSAPPPSLNTADPIQLQPGAAAAATAPIQRYQGTITNFNPFGGGGKIKLSDGREVQVRYSSVRGKGVRKLVKGATVTFMLEETQRGLYAVCVQRDSAPDTAD